LYQRVLKTYPQHADALHLLGLLTHQMGDDAGAQALIRRAIAVSPNVAAYHHSLGQVLAASGHTDRAIDSLARAAQLDPAADTFEQLALLLEKQRRLIEALDSAQRAAE